MQDSIELEDKISSPAEIDTEIDLQARQVRSHYSQLPNFTEFTTFHKTHTTLDEKAALVAFLRNSIAAIKKQRNIEMGLFIVTGVLASLLFLLLFTIPIAVVCFKLAKDHHTKAQQSIDRYKQMIDDIEHPTPSAEVITEDSPLIHPISPSLRKLGSPSSQVYGQPPEREYPRLKDTVALSAVEPGYQMLFSQPILPRYNLTPSPVRPATDTGESEWMRYRSLR